MPETMTEICSIAEQYLAVMPQTQRDLMRRLIEHARVSLPGVQIPEMEALAKELGWQDIDGAKRPLFYVLNHITRLREERNTLAAERDALRLWSDVPPSQPDTPAVGGAVTEAMVRVKELETAITVAKQRMWFWREWTKEDGDLEFHNAIHEGLLELQAVVPDAPDTVRARDVVERECETCQGVGYIDERLGGYSDSNPRATCPDCDGTGDWPISSSRN